MKKCTLFLTIVLNLTYCKYKAIQKVGPELQLGIAFVEAAASLANLSYSGSPFTFNKDTAITTQTPTHNGTISTCSSNPTLPEGLSLDTVSCSISGTPTTVQSETSYTITAGNTRTNTAGETVTENTSTTISIAVNDAAPTSIAYGSSSYCFTSTIAISTETPTISGTVTSCSASPSLPSGLSLDATTCAISGTPTTKQSSTSYTITASNSGGSTNTTISIIIDGVWVQQAYVKATNAGSQDYFGYDVGISSDTIVVGAYGEDSNQTTITNGTTASANDSSSNSGAAYVYTRSGTTWTQEAYLKPPVTATSDQFGFSVAIDTDTIVVGSWLEGSNQTTITNGTTGSTDNSASNSGAAYVYTRSGTTWTQQAYLKAPNAESSDFFGYDVGISSDTIVVGAYGEASNQTTITNGTSASTNNSANNSGAAYVFKRSGTTWAQEAYLKAANAEGDDFFGDAVAISSDTIVVGAYGEDSNQTTITNGTTASSDNTLSIVGAAYVFKRSGTTWAQEAYLKPPNGETNDAFGRAISVNGDTIAIGAFQEDSNQTTITNGTTASSDNSQGSSGAVYVFKRSGTTWAQEAYIKAPNAFTSTQFGIDVAIESDTLVVGSNWEDSNQTTITNGSTASSDTSVNDAGAVYVFKRNGTTWEQRAYAKAPNPDSSDYFGVSVGISSDTMVVGAEREDSNQTTITNGTTASADDSTSDSGAVYILIRE
ncbi:MAG: putative Ig domain-containing protein [Spirochaetota bacterium]